MSVKNTPTNPELAAKIAVAEATAKLSDAEARHAEALVRKRTATLQRMKLDVEIANFPKAK